MYKSVFVNDIHNQLVNPEISCIRMGSGPALFGLARFYCIAIVRMMQSSMNFLHQSFLTTILIMVDHYPLLEFPCDSGFCLDAHAAKLINANYYNVCIVAASAPPPRHQHPQCFHIDSFCLLSLASWPCPPQTFI